MNILHTICKCSAPLIILLNHAKINRYDPYCKNCRIMFIFGSHFMSSLKCSSSNARKKQEQTIMFMLLNISSAAHIPVCFHILNLTVELNTLFSAEVFLSSDFILVIAHSINYNSCREVNNLKLSYCFCTEVLKCDYFCCFHRFCY